MKPGIYDHMPNAEYHGADGISKSGLDLIARSPAHYKYAQDHQRESTDSMDKGSLVHDLVLEPNHVDERYAVMPASIKQRRGKEYEAFKASAGERKILTAPQMEEGRRIAQAVHTNPVAMEIITRATGEGYIEQSVFAEDFGTGMLCKCRPDIRIGNRLYDLKTTRNAAGRSFAYSARNFRYHVQAAFYMDVCRWAGIEVDHFGFIAVDTDVMPYQCTVFHDLSPGSMEQGRGLYTADLSLYAQCMESGEWPGYPDEYQILDVSGYAYDELDMEAE